MQEGGTVLVRVRDDAVLEVINHGEGVQFEDREMFASRSGANATRRPERDWASRSPGI